MLPKRVDILVGVRLDGPSISFRIMLADTDLTS